ncbi:formyltransferase family protein [Urechidicola vernalis]|uniref:Formyltransferase family protein n=1 Tax=Urechidicola vernalis TaxID=3075600 RepID=A0ABU2Y7H0_9FLAO|nr:formyltransferase family protein [Urechidicola sp. P050]MDT0554149.1 formyltransferase family protein [Urechidicola sp. P050]
MRIFFIGTVEFSKRSLEKLIDINANVVGVATKTKSSFNADFADIVKVCKENDLNYKSIANINSAECINWIRSLKPDVIFCFGWSNLLKKEILNLAPLGVVGYHPTELPKNRGRHPIIWALVLGLKNTASTFFFMKEGADDGDILSQKKVSISWDDDAQKLYDKLSTVALTQIETFHEELKSKTYTRTPQDHSIANLWRKRGKNDGRIDFRMSSEAIYNLIRGLAKPYIGAHIEKEGKDIMVWKSKVGNNYNRNIEPGKVIQIVDSHIEVKTGNASIWLINHEFSNLPKPNEYL